MENIRYEVWLQNQDKFVTQCTVIPFGIQSQSCFLILPASEEGNIRKQLWLRIPKGIKFTVVLIQKISGQ